jgi:hypothetical protein
MCSKKLYTGIGRGCEQAIPPDYMYPGDNTAIIR